MKINGNKQPEASVDYAIKVKNAFAHSLTNLVTVRAFLEKYGYGRYWNRWDVKDLYDTYTILKCKNYE